MQYNLKNIGFDFTSCYATAHDHAKCYDTCHAMASCGKPTAGAPAVIIGSLGCECGRNFKRQGDLTHHHNFCDYQFPPSHHQLWNLNVIVIGCSIGREV